MRGRLVATDAGDDINNDHADWALARIDCGADGTAPTVTARTPVPGATGVALDVHPTATFSEAMNPTTVTTQTLTLVKSATGTPIAAAVSYDAGTLAATLTPSASLEAATSYVVTVKGGSTGEGPAGNPLAADVSWTFDRDKANQRRRRGSTLASSLSWKVGDLVTFSGHATDPQQGTLARRARLDADPALRFDLSPAALCSPGRAPQAARSTPRPRVPVTSRAAAHRDRLRRADAPASVSSSTR